MILIISSSKDIHAVRVMQELDRTGADYTLLDLSNFPKQYYLTMEPGNKGSAGDYRFSLNGSGVLDLSKVNATWWRRPQAFTLHDDITRESHMKFAFNECHEAVAGLWHSLDCHWMNNPAKDDIGHRKAYQLKVARETGLDIPATCITNNPADATGFLNRLGNRKAICKSFSATWDEWRETRIVTEQELQHISNVKYAPVIFQEYVEAQYDIRITVVGDEIFAAAIYSQETDYKVDMRMDIGNARIEAVDLPESVNKLLSTFMKRLGLVYGAIDMRLTPEGKYVFLEINPAGQWLFIEEKSGQPITAHVAGYLRSQDEKYGVPAKRRAVSKVV